VVQLIIVAMGKVITEEEKESWDSNAITPGTSLMDLLASSLQYWVVEKMNADPRWNDVRSEYLLGTLFIHFFPASSYHIR
jgi:5'-3' exonuclease